MKRIVLALASLLLLAGCGSSGGGSSAPPLTKAAYQAKVQAIGRELTEALAHATGGSDATARLASLNDAQQKIRHTADELAALRPPADVESANKQLADGLRGFSDALGSLATAVKSGDQAKELAALQQVASSPASRKIKEATDTLRAKGYSLSTASTN